MTCFTTQFGQKCGAHRTSRLKRHQQRPACFNFTFGNCSNVHHSRKSALHSIMLPSSPSNSGVGPLDRHWTLPPSSPLLLSVHPPPPVSYCTVLTHPWREKPGMPLSDCRPPLAANNSQPIRGPPAATAVVLFH